MLNTTLYKMSKCKNIAVLVKQKKYKKYKILSVHTDLYITYKMINCEKKNITLFSKTSPLEF